MIESRQLEIDPVTGESVVPETIMEEDVAQCETAEEAAEEDRTAGEAAPSDPEAEKSRAFEETAMAMNTLYASMLPRDLPIGLKDTLMNVPERMKMPVLCGVLPLAMSYATNVTYCYCDGKTQRLNLMSIIYGRQASGKSSVRDAVDLWLRSMKEQDAIGREEEEDFKRRRKSRKANEKLPEEPKPVIREVPITISCSTLLKRLKNSQGQHLFSFGEELGTLQKTNGAGSWSSKYDIYRLGFDNGSWGQDYNSDQAESGVVDVAYNWSVLGTLGAVEKCFKADSIENGMCGRVLFAQMPSEFFSHMPVYQNPKPINAENIDQAIERLSVTVENLVLPRLKRAIRAWCNRKADEAREEGDIAMDTLRKRAAVIGFRAGVVYYLLQGKEKETQGCLKFAELIADYALMNQMTIFGPQLEEVLKGNISKSAPEKALGSFQKIFAQLPENFSIGMLKEVYPNRTDSTHRSNLHNFIQKGYLMKIGKGLYRKTPEGKKI